jgi:hypothetical protein
MQRPNDSSWGQFPSHLLVLRFAIRPYELVATIAILGNLYTQKYIPQAELEQLMLSKIDPSTWS